MKLLKGIGTRKNKNGTAISYAVFFCDYCKKEVVRKKKNGLEQKGCGCVKKWERNRGAKLIGDDKKERTCIMCQKKFMSTWSGDRRCKTCRDKINNYVDLLYAPTVYKHMPPGGI